MPTDTLIWYGDDFLKEVDRAMLPTTEAAAEQVEADMKLHAPVESGTLRGSIRTYESRYEGGGHTVFIGGKGGWGDAWYWSFVVLGTHRSDPKPFPQQALARCRATVPANLKKFRMRHKLSVRQRKRLKII